MISEYFAVSQNKEDKWVFSLSVWGKKQHTYQNGALMEV